ncbi:hypothetical protein [Bradyrhizobium elkanii]|uniref:hypothetical protein n=1 Tax=Bradyrhizobium elkanii TaxID=29448 RepID=UPI00040BC880|nr:hypothetical protein [Bradyrhizobium elkanii]
MPRWSAGLQNVAKVTNHRHGKPAKVLIRRNVLEAVGRDVEVFDAFAGSGEMYREVWRQAAGYVGCDQKWFRDERCAYVADNRRVLRAIDLAPFSIFDFDAFGSPWEQMLIVAARRKVAAGERLGVVLTEGSMINLKQGGLPKALGAAAGLTGRLSGWHAGGTRSSSARLQALRSALAAPSTAAGRQRANRRRRCFTSAWC